MKKAFVDTYGIKSADLKNKLLFKSLQLSELPKCHKKAADCHMLLRMIR